MASRDFRPHADVRDPGPGRRHPLRRRQVFGATLAVGLLRRLCLCGRARHHRATRGRTVIRHQRRSRRALRPDVSGRRVIPERGGARQLRHSRTGFCARPGNAGPSQSRTRVGHGRVGGGRGSGVLRTRVADRDRDRDRSRTASRQGSIRPRHRAPRDPEDRRGGGRRPGAGLGGEPQRSLCQGPVRNPSEPRQ